MSSTEIQSKYAGRDQGNEAHQTTRGQHLNGNLTANQDSWGDDITVKSSRSFRLYFQNINGLCTTELNENWIDILHFMETNSVDMYGLAETNVRWTRNLQTYLYQSLRTNISEGKQQVKMVTASCNEPVTGTYQPGGVCQVTLGRLVLE